MCRNAAVVTSYRCRMGTEFSAVISLFSEDQCESEVCKHTLQLYCFRSLSLMSFVLYDQQGSPNRRSAYLTLVSSRSSEHCRRRSRSKSRSALTRVNSTAACRASSIASARARCSCFSDCSACRSFLLLDRWLGFR